MADLEEKTGVTPGGLLDGLPEPVDISGVQFLFGPERSQGGALTIGQVDPDRMVLRLPDGNYRSAPGPKNPIGPVQGYSEIGKDSWRASNDDVIVAAVNKYNAANQYFPGDADYMTPQLVKAWMMRESGGSPSAFKTDPFQVNTPGDWPKDGSKGRVASLSLGQAMTPKTSADAALKWARYKSTWPGLEFSSPLARRAHYGAYEALMNYNGNKQLVDGVPFRVGYANDIMNRAWASYGDWQK